jgi:hypothetical protein
VELKIWLLPSSGIEAKLFSGRPAGFRMVDKGKVCIHFIKPNFTALDHKTQLSSFKEVGFS